MSTALPLRGVRVVSLALNLPGPAALMRLKSLGATCTKAEPPAGDPMQNYSPAAYAALKQGLADGRIRRDERAVLFNCATGLKYPLPPVHRTLDRLQPIDFAAL